MTTRTISPNHTTEQLALGPGQALRVCILCGQILRDGEHWRRMAAPDNAYAVAVHDTCLAQRRNGRMS